MQVTESDLVAITEWAKACPEIAEVWLYGSRAKGDNRDDSDIDLAVVTVGADADERYNRWFGADWRNNLKLSREVHLEWYDHEAEFKRVGPGVERDGKRLYPE